jgi:hypothetical protein
MLFYKGETVFKVNHTHQGIKIFLGSLKAKELEPMMKECLL